MHSHSTTEALKTFSKTLPGFLARKEELSTIRTNFMKRFIPIPVDSYGTPFHLHTAVPLVEKMKERDQLRFLHFNPTLLSINEVSKLVRNGLLSVSRGGGLGSAAISDELNELKREELERIFERDIYDVMQHNEATLLNLENVYGMEGIVNNLASNNNNNNNKSSPHHQESDRQQFHRVWSKGRWFVAGAGKDCRPFYNNINMTQQSDDSKHDKKSKTKLAISRSKTQPKQDTSHLFFSHESFAQELEVLYRAHGYKSRLWIPPSALPRTLAAKNGEVNRLQVSYCLPKKLVPGYVLESRFINNNNNGNNNNIIINSSGGAYSNNNYERSRIGRPFHFWARTGTRVHFSEEEFAKLAPWIRQARWNTDTCEVGNFAWFSSLDLKLFGYRVREGEQPMMNFVEERLVTCVPLSPPYLSTEQLALLDSCSLLPAPPPARTDNNGKNMIRLLRSDFRWSMLPSNRVELPHDEDDADAVLQVPLVDSKVLSSLGIMNAGLVKAKSTGNNNNNNNNHISLPPLVLTMKIPVAAYNVAQLIPEEKDSDLPAPWMIVK